MAEHRQQEAIAGSNPAGSTEVNMIPLTEEQEKELDEMAKRFKDTKGGK